MPVFRLDQEYRLAMFKQSDRAVENIELVSFDVDFNKGNLFMDDRIEPGRRDCHRNHFLA